MVKLTKKEYIKFMSKRTGMTVVQINELQRKKKIDIVKCDCNKSFCKGWL